MLNSKIMNVIENIQNNLLVNNFKPALADNFTGFMFCSGRCDGTCEDSCRGSCEGRCDGGCEYGCVAAGEGF